MRIAYQVFAFIVISVVKCQEQCGKQKSAHPLIFGGVATSVGEWPWLVPLMYRTNNKFFCASNLISHQHLLTAAHCMREKKSARPFTKEDMYAYIGRFDITESIFEENSKKEDIKKIIIHPDWKPEDIRYDADIAILVLKNQIEYSDNVQPVCLPGQDLQAFNIRGNVIGYGKSESDVIHEPRPRKVEISSQTNENCFISDYRFARFGSPRTFCAGERGKTPCQGDSGSGFLIDVRSSWTIVGLVSAATVQECGSNDYVLFTNIPKFTEWIQNEMANTNSDTIQSAFDAFDKDPSTNSNVVEADCRFQTVGSSYACFVNGLTAPDQDIELKINGGQHKAPRTNRDVTAMQMIKGTVTHFPDLTNVLTTFPNLNGFGITFTKMKQVDRSKLRNLGNLKFFLINDNEIEEIPADTFLDLKNLELIDICRNQIKKLEPNWISAMSQLKVFKARTNKFEYVPSNMFKNNKKLEEILFDYNQIKRIDVNFSELTNLKTLAILGNSCIDKEYCNDDNNSNCIKSLQQFSYIVTGYCGNFSK